MGQLEINIKRVAIVIVWVISVSIMFSRILIDHINGYDVTRALELDLPIYMLAAIIYLHHWLFGGQKGHVFWVYRILFLCCFAIVYWFKYTLYLPLYMLLIIGIPVVAHYWMRKDLKTFRLDASRGIRRNHFT